MLAAQKGQGKMAQELLVAGAAVNLANSKGFTPLHMAAQNGHEAVVRLLLAAGADLRLADDVKTKNLFDARH